MENNDDDLFRRLTAYGCRLPDNITNVSQIPHSFVLPIVQKLLDIIGGEEDTPIPTSKGDQVLLASRMASTCKDLGYEEELGYDLFIYPNELDLRAILLFLLELLSEDNKKSHFSESSEGLSLIMRNISIKLYEELEKPWVPLYCKPKSFNVTSDGIWTRDGSSFVEPYQSIPFKITRDVKSITQAFMDYWKYVVPNSNETFEVEDYTENDMHEADFILNKLKQKQGIEVKVYEDKTEIVIQQLENETQSVNKPTDIQQIDIENLDIDLLRDKKERNIIFESIIQNENIDSENIKLIEEKLLQKINSIQDDIKEINTTISMRNKNAITEQENKVEDSSIILERRLKNKAIKLKKAKKNKVFFSISPDKERLIQTNDVTEMIDHLNKLKIDMNKIISNVNTTQKEINNINGILDRSFVVADELIFKEAKKEEFARKTYKLIANVHTECNELCRMVKEIGVFARDTVALEKNVETALRKNIKENLERATEDLRNLSKK